MSLILLVVMALASYRLYRFLGADTWPPAEWFRIKVEDRQTFSEWLTCPWCAGAYFSAAVVAWVDLFVGLELPVLQWFAVSCLVGLIGRADG